MRESMREGHSIIRSTPEGGIVMARRSFLRVGALALVWALLPGITKAATPGAGTVSSASSSAGWQGGPFLLSNPATCLSSGPAVPGCNRFALTVAPPAGSYVVEISTAPAGPGDDYDLFVYDAAGNLVDSSATGGGTEKVALSGLPAGTYQVVVQAFLVGVNSTYRGTATLRTVTEDELARAYRATPVPPGFAGTPVNSPAPYHGSCLVLRSTEVARDAAEPTLRVRK